MIPFPEETQAAFDKGELKPNSTKRIEQALESGEIVRDKSGRMFFNQKDEPIPKPNAQDQSDFLKTVTSGLAGGSAGDSLGAAMASPGAVRTTVENNPEIVAKGAQTGLELGGMGAGATAGFATGGPGGAVGGATLGGMGGNVMFQMLQRAGIIPGEPADIGDATMQAADAGVAGGLGQIPGELIFKIASKAAKPFVNTVIPEVEEAGRIIKPVGGKLTPATLTDSRTLDLLENISESSFFDFGGIARVKAKGLELFEKVINGVIRKFASSSSKQEVGATLQTLITDARDVFGNTAKKMFGRLDDLTEGATVNARPILRLAQRRLDELQQGVTGSPAIAILKKLLTKGDEAGQMTFKQAQLIRSELLGIGRSTTELSPGRTQGIARNVAKMVDRQMALAAKRTGNPEALEAFRKANAFWAAGKTQFNNSVIKSIIKDFPELVIDKFLKAGKPSLIKLARGIVNNKKAWRQVQGSFVEDLIKNSRNTDGALLGKKIINNIEKFEGGNGLEEIFVGSSLAIVKSIKKMAVGMKAIQAGTPEATGKMFIQMKQSGAIAQTAGAVLAWKGGLDPTSTFLLVAPSTLGLMFTNTKVIDFITKGITLGSGTRQAATFMTRLMALLTKEGIEYSAKQDPEEHARLTKGDQFKNKPFTNLF